MVSEPQSEGKENQQEEIAAATAASTTYSPASPAAARSSEKCPGAPESCVFPARLRARRCHWGSGANWGGVEPHCHPVTHSGLQQQSNSRLSHEEHGLCSNPQERPLPPTHNVHQLIQLSEEKWRQEQIQMGSKASRKTLPQNFTFFGLTLSASEETEMMTAGTSRGTGRSIVSTG